VTGYKLNGFLARHPLSILPSKCGTTSRAQNWRTSAPISWLKPTRLSVADYSDSATPGVYPTPSYNTQAFLFEHLSLYYAKLNSSAVKGILNRLLPMLFAHSYIRYQARNRRNNASLQGRSRLMVGTVRFSVGAISSRFMPPK
jgi:hypothetical protein